MVERSVGAGANLSIILSAAEGRDAGDGPGECAGSSGASIRVLYVEDEPNITQMVAEMLKALDFKVTAASTAFEALGLLSSGQPFDLLFTDIVLGGSMNGIDLAREATVRLPAIKVLLTSGYPRDALKGGDELTQNMVLLKKPYRRAALVDALQRALTTVGGADRM